MAGKWAGFETVQFVEKDLFCQKVLRKHWPHVPIYDDIKTFSYKEKIDLITGGFPCQPFSIAGSKKGKEDERYLWEDFYRIIRESYPKWIIVENVSHLIHMAFDEIITDLEKEKYDISSFILPAFIEGAPHKRNRLWIIANAYSESSIKTNQISQSIENFWKTWMGLTGQIRIKQRQYWKKNQSPVPGMDDGISNWMDRNKSLGNSIVPQIVYPIMKFIIEIEKYENN